jgi:hypothetical protein
MKQTLSQAFTESLKEKETTLEFYLQKFKLLIRQVNTQNYYSSYEMY